jgi:17beta-estradiol 17-dehydrogenase / very-long-chain 3-oxoacyl-CoA reductase
MTQKALVDAFQQGPFLLKAVMFIGLFVIMNVIVFLFSVIYRTFLRPAKNLKKYGMWAVVTGATDGIGKAMAAEFARRGLNIVLISRTQEKLDETTKEIKEKNPKVEVRSIAVDYDQFDEAAQKRVSQILDTLDIGVLVNNVGISYDFTKYFHELDDQRVRQLIRLNVDSTTYMTRIVLPGMIQRKRGAIINIGSAAGVTTSPLLAQYGAAKSYVAMFSKALNEELGGFNIHVQCQVPLFVTTKLAKLKKSSFFVPTPSAYARSALNAIGYESVISPYWPHALQVWLLNSLPEALSTMITKNMHLDIRRKGMKKLQEQKPSDKKHA